MSKAENVVPFPQTPNVGHNLGSPSVEQWAFKDLELDHILTEWVRSLLQSQEAAHVQKVALPLSSAKPAHQSGGNIMADNPSREEIQDKIAASEARTEARVVRLEGKIDTLVATIGGRMDVLASKIDALNDKASAAQADNLQTRSEIQAYNLQTRSEISESRRWTMGTTIVVGLALAGLIVGMLTYGDEMVGRGMTVRDLVQTTIKELQQAQTPPERK
jgi:hypothetical protein